MGNGRTSNEGKALKIAETVIGVRKGKYHGEQIEFSIYYGNLSLPLVDNKFVHLTPEKYDEMLHDFLYESQQGAEYAVPSTEEKREAMKMVLEKEDELLRQILKKNEPEPIKKEPVVYDKEELENLYNLKNLDEPEMPNIEAEESVQESASIEESNPIQKNTTDSDSLINRLKMRTVIQTVLIVFQLICIIVLSILLMKGK